MGYQVEVDGSDGLAAPWPHISRSAICHHAAPPEAPRHPWGDKADCVKFYLRDGGDGD